MKTYKLAKNRNHAAAMDSTFGPLMTLAQAQAYQADMIRGGFDVLVVNMATDRDYAMRPNKGNAWQRHAH